MIGGGGGGDRVQGMRGGEDQTYFSSDKLLSQLKELTPVHLACEPMC